jgi:hypothetical protein
MNYVPLVWEEAIENKNISEDAELQRLINIKIVKAYRTRTYTASCMLAGVQPIGIEIIGNTCLHKRKHSTGKEDNE